MLNCARDVTGRVVRSVADVDVLCLASWREAADTYALWRLSGPGFTDHDSGYRCIVSYSDRLSAFSSFFLSFSFGVAHAPFACHR